MINLDKLVRKNILNLKPYSSARDEFQGDASVFLDANENPFNPPYNRYPDPLQRKLKEKIAAIKKVGVDQIFLGNGSDEPIDIVIRVFCEPSQDNIVAIDPTYGMYQVAADINNIEYRKVLLDEGFSLNADKLLAACDKHTKLIFLCSPNNPTGNYLNEKEIDKILDKFEGIVLLDEAYIDFSGKKGYLGKLSNYSNLIILHTFSKAWGLASIRLGMAFAAKEIVSLFNKVKYPYNINLLTQQYALEVLDQTEEKDDWVKCIIANKVMLIEELESVPSVREIYPSDANFFLIKVDDPYLIYDYLVENKIIVRNRATISLCAGCLRVTVGTQQENELLVKALKKF